MPCRTSTSPFWILLPALLAGSIAEGGLPDIKYSAILEASPEAVWEKLTKPKGVAQWLVGKAPQWSPEPGGKWRVVLAGEAEVAGEFATVAAPASLQLKWPSPPSTLKLNIKPLDERFTRVSLVHGDWRDTSSRSKRHQEYMRNWWLAALMRLHRLFPPAHAAKKEHRGAVEGVFVARNLVVNGDFELLTEGSQKGVAYGWETASRRSSTGSYAVDRITTHASERAQRIANPPDWTRFAVQQFTPYAQQLIEPGKRYRLSGWVRAQRIRNPAGWYKLGLWFTDIRGRPIGEPLKNKRIWGTRDVLVNHDWRHYVIEGEAPKGAARAAVILTAHWDESGVVWYDDILLWEVEEPSGKTGG
jgi:uncharacterized protein YndB with AHSA1/START domain